MSAILMIAGMTLIVYGFVRNAAPFTIGGIVLFIIGMLVANRGRSRRRRDDGGSGDTTTSYESHHDSHGHDSGWGDSSGDSGGGDGGGGGD